MTTRQKIKNIVQSVANVTTQKIIPRVNKLFDFPSVFAVDLKTHRRAAIFSASLIFLVVIIQNPASIFAGNVDEFSLNTVDYFGLLIPAFIVAAIALSLPALILRGRYLAIYALLLTFIALQIWAYSNLLVVNFGQLDGGKFDFSFINRLWLLEVIFLTAAFSGLIFLYKNYARQVSYFLITLNIIVVAAVAIQLGFNFQSGRKFTEVDNQAIYRVSETKNVLIILMDQFQSDIFADLVQNNESFRNELEGFTFFPDTLGVAPTTRLTMPSVHSGEFYRTGPRLAHFYKNRVVRGSFLNALSDSGHEVVLVSPPLLGCPRKAALCKAVWTTIFRRDDLLNREIIRLVDFSLFRASPFISKQTVYNDGGWVFSARRMNTQHFVVTSNRFLNQLSTTMEVSGSKPATKFVHLMSTHRPYVVDENCKFTGNNRSQRRRTQMYNQATCALGSFIDVLQKLKSLDAYDNTTIMLIADTGVGAFNIGSSHGTETGEPKYNGAGLYGAANPVLLVKPMNERGPYSVSSNQVQLTDVASTICSLTGDCRDFPGTSVFETRNEDHSRFYNLYHMTPEWDNKGFIPTPRALEVNGPIWELSSWPDDFQPRMQPGTLIKFNHEEQNAVYLGEGWGPIKVEGTFSYADEANLFFYPEEELADAYEFIVTAEDTFSTPGKGDDIIEVYVNGQLVDSWVYSTPGKVVVQKVTIPKELIAAQELLEIRFKLKSPTSWVVERNNVRHMRTRGFRLISTKFEPVGAN